jgi:glutamate synthase domain-containing protein 2
VPLQHLPGRRLHPGRDARGKFVGTPEKVINLFSFVAEEVREILASLGFRA